MHLGIDFWKDFGGFLEAKWRHVGTKIEQKSMPTSKNDFWVLTCLHVPSQNPPKSLQKPLLKGIDFLIDFGIDFFTIFARFGRPTWGHVGHFFLQKGATATDANLYFLESI